MKLFNHRLQRVVVSTHSRLKAAGLALTARFCVLAVSTHSRLKAAGILDSILDSILDVSTHSRLKAAGIVQVHLCSFTKGFNTQPPEGGW